MQKLINILCLFCSVLFYNDSNAQQIPSIYSMEQYRHWGLADNINRSDLVVEGAVIATEDFFLDPNSRRVFTSAIIRISKIFKGEVKDTIIELIIDGGTFPSGEFKGVGVSSEWGMRFKGEEGLFFLRVNSTGIRSKKIIQSYFFLYGRSVMLYNHEQPRYPMTGDGTKRYDDLQRDLYPEIEAITGTPAKVIGLNSFEAAKKGQKK